MTETTRRPRGRPKGSELDDRKALSEMADLLVQTRARNVADAVRRIAGHDPSLIRRLQRKFQRDRETLLALASARAAQLALQEGVREDQILRSSRASRWRHEHDPATQLMDALDLDRRETLSKAFAGNQRGIASQGRPSRTK